ncbi:MAG: NADH-quinone oxidoreductase subunit NuoF [Elusimicrobiota bacterium]
MTAKTLTKNPVGLTTQNKIRSVSDYDALRKVVSAERNSYETRISVGCSSCSASDAEALRIALTNAVVKNGLQDRVLVRISGCHGFCAQGPLVLMIPEGICYVQVKPEDADEIIEKTVAKGNIIKRLLYVDPKTNEAYQYERRIPFYKKQMRLLMDYNKRIDPRDIRTFIAIDGYDSLAKVLSRMSPEDVILEVKNSGLRGRGGAGFPTAFKWDFCRKAKGEPKYVICNADEGDPGAYMDRSVMESNPHSVLEGMIIGAYAIGAREGYIYIRNEYPVAVKHIQEAVKHAYEYGLLGKNILNTGFDFDVHVERGAGAFVCGEETALIAAIEGRPGVPMQRPPFPATNGLWGKPTNINNVETWANVPLIFTRGASWYSHFGTRNSKGTKIFSLVGKVRNTGLVEVPMGTTFREIIYDIGGGIKDDRQFKAVQTGGPSGGCIPEEYLDLMVDYESLAKAGSIMGSGGMIVMDEQTCMVDVAKYFMNFLRGESCGKCLSCREGTQRLWELLGDICEGRGTEEHVGLIEELALTVKESSMCGLGQTAGNPVLSTLRYFREEYEEHIRDGKCRAGVCTMGKAPCELGCPISMNIPAYIALTQAGRLDDAYRVLKRTNPFPSVCGRVCSQQCVSKCRRAQLDEALAIKNLKRFITDQGERPRVEKIPTTRKERIAVVGAGPSGLAAAWELRKRGYAVTVFEEHKDAGGMMRLCIPAFRLPHEVLEQEIQDIVATGVELRLGTKVGRDVSFAELDQDFKHIYLAVGAQFGAVLGIPGEKATGVYDALRYLKEVNAGRKTGLGRRVAVIGGGNTAIDAARTAVRDGASEVTIFYRRQRQEMPALKEEVEAAEAEGVKIEFLAAPVQVLANNDRVAALELRRMKLGDMDASGRRRPIPIEGSEFKVEVDAVISAVGQEADLGFVPAGSGVRITRNRVLVDGKFHTSMHKVWAGGDVVTGPAMVIDAIHAGVEAARAIDAAVRKAKGEGPWIPPLAEPIAIPMDPPAGSKKQPCVHMPTLAAGRRRDGFQEVETGYSDEQARLEASRCLRCDFKAEPPVVKKKGAGKTEIRKGKRGRGKKHA